MKLSASLVSTLLLFIPSLVSAAPTETNRSLFARDGQTCVPKTLAANDVEGKRRQKEILDKMHAATREAHEGEDACKAQKNTEFNQSKDKKKRTEIKNTCTAGWQKCITKRKAANGYCKNVGGTVDAGHEKAVKFCQDKLAEWKAKNP